MRKSSEEFERAAEAIAGNPRLWRALLFAHAPNQDGECYSCRGVPWPCGPRALAERAEQMYAEG